MLIACLLAASPPAFDPIRFFSGRTHGEGRIKVVLRRRSPIRVDGQGRILPDGTLVLDQVVTHGDHAPTKRQWRLRQVAPGHYEGVLSDARGPVLGDVVDDRLRLRFKSTAGFDIEQVIAVDPDGRRAANHLVARRLGIVFATLDEEIVKTD